MADTVNVGLDLKANVQQFIAGIKQSRDVVTGLNKQLNVLVGTLERAAKAATSKAAAQGKATAATQAGTRANKGHFVTQQQLIANETMLNALYTKNSAIAQKKYLSGLTGLRNGLDRFNKEAGKTLTFHKDHIGLLSDSENAYARFMMKGNMITRTFSNMATQVLNVGKNLQWTGRQMMVGITLPVTALGALAVKSYLEWDKAIIRNQKLLTAHGRTIQEQNQSIIDQSKELQEFASQISFGGIVTSGGTKLPGLGVNTTELAKTQNIFAAIIDDVSQINKLTQLSAEFNIIGDLDDQAKAADAVRLIWQSYDGNIERTRKTLEKFNAIENETNLQMSDIAEGIGDVTGTLKHMNMTVEEGAAFMAAITQQGYSASEAARSLNFAFAKLPAAAAYLSKGETGGRARLKELIEIIDAFNKANPDQAMKLFDEKTGKRLVNGSQLLLQTAKMWDTFDERARTTFARAAFGADDIAKLGGLMDNLNKSLRGDSAQDFSKAFAIALDQSSSSAERWAKELGTVLGSPNAEVQRQLAKLIDSSQKVGRELFKQGLPLLQKFVDWVGRAVAWFGELSEKTKELIGRFVLLAIAMGPITYLGGQAILLFTQLAKFTFLTPLKALFQISSRLKDVAGGEGVVAAIQRLNDLYDSGGIGIKQYAGGLEDAMKQQIALKTSTESTTASILRQNAAMAGAGPASVAGAARAAGGSRPLAGGGLFRGFRRPNAPAAVPRTTSKLSDLSMEEIQAQYPEIWEEAIKRTGAKGYDEEALEIVGSRVRTSTVPKDLPKLLGATRQRKSKEGTLGNLLNRMRPGSKDREDAKNKAAQEVARSIAVELIGEQVEDQKEFKRLFQLIVPQLIQSNALTPGMMYDDDLMRKLVTGIAEEASARGPLTQTNIREVIAGIGMDATFLERLRRGGPAARGNTRLQREVHGYLQEAQNIIDQKVKGGTRGVLPVVLPEMRELWVSTQARTAPEMDKKEEDAVKTYKKDVTALEQEGIMPRTGTGLARDLGSKGDIVPLDPKNIIQKFTKNTAEEFRLQNIRITEELAKIDQQLTTGVGGAVRENLIARQKLLQRHQRKLRQIWKRALGAIRAGALPTADIPEEFAKTIDEVNEQFGVLTDPRAAKRRATLGTDIDFIRQKGVLENFDSLTSPGAMQVEGGANKKGSAIERAAMQRRKDSDLWKRVEAEAARIEKEESRKITRKEIDAITKEFTEGSSRTPEGLQAVVSSQKRGMANEAWEAMAISPEEIRKAMPAQMQALGIKTHGRGRIGKALVGRLAATTKSNRELLESGELPPDFMELIMRRVHRGESKQQLRNALKKLPGMTPAKYDEISEDIIARVMDISNDYTTMLGIDQNVINAIDDARKAPPVETRQLREPVPDAGQGKIIDDKDHAWAVSQKSLEEIDEESKKIKARAQEIAKRRIDSEKRAKDLEREIKEISDAPHRARMGIKELEPVIRADKKEIDYLRGRVAAGPQQLVRQLGAKEGKKRWEEIQTQLRAREEKMAERQAQLDKFKSRSKNLTRKERAAMERLKREMLNVQGDVERLRIEERTFLESNRQHFLQSPMTPVVRGVKQGGGESGGEFDPTTGAMHVEGGREAITEGQIVAQQITEDAQRTKEEVEKDLRELRRARAVAWSAEQKLREEIEQKKKNIPALRRAEDSAMPPPPKPPTDHTGKRIPGTGFIMLGSGEERPKGQPRIVEPMFGPGVPESVRPLYGPHISEIGPKTKKSRAAQKAYDEQRAVIDAQLEEVRAMEAQLKELRDKQAELKKADDRLVDESFRTVGPADATADLVMRAEDDAKAIKAKQAIFEEKLRVIDADIADTKRQQGETRREHRERVGRAERARLRELEKEAKATRRDLKNARDEEARIARETRRVFMLRGEDGEFAETNLAGLEAERQRVRQQLEYDKNTNRPGAIRRRAATKMANRAIAERAMASQDEIVQSRLDRQFQRRSRRAQIAAFATGGMFGSFHGDLPQDDVDTMSQMIRRDVEAGAPERDIGRRDVRDERRGRPGIVGRIRARRAAPEGATTAVKGVAGQVKNIGGGLKEASAIAGKGILNAALWMTPGKALKGMGQGLVKLQGGLKESGNIFKKTLGPMVEMFAPGAGMAMASILNAIGPLLIPIGLVAGGIILIWKNWSKVQKGIGSGLKTLRAGFKAIKDAILEPFRQVFDRLKGDGEGMSNMWKSIGQIINVFGHIIGRVFKAAAVVIRPIMNVLSEVLNILIRLIQFMVSVFTGQWGSAWKALKDIAASALEVILEGLLYLPRMFLKVAAGIIGLASKIPWVGNFADSVKKDIQRFEKWIATLPDAAGNMVNSDRRGDEEKGKKSAKDWVKGFKRVKPPKPKIERPEANEAGEAAASEFIDAFQGQMRNVVDKWKDSALKAYDTWADAQVNSVDKQIQALDDLEKKEEEVHRNIEYLREKEEMARRRRSAEVKYQRDRDLAIYEGRYDDAKALDLEFETTKSDLHKDEVEFEENRQKELLKAERDAQKESLELAKDNLKARLDLQKDNLQAQLDAITEYIPKNVSEANRMQQQILGALGSYTGQYGAVGAGMMGSWATAIEAAGKEVAEKAFWAGEEAKRQFAAGMGISLTNPVPNAAPRGMGSAIQNFSRDRGIYGTLAPNGRATPEWTAKRNATRRSGSIMKVGIMHSGGMVGDKDRGPKDVDATLQTGEFVIQRKAVQNLGLDVLNQLNEARPKFHDGGLVGIATQAMSQDLDNAVQQFMSGQASIGGLTKDIAQQAIQGMSQAGGAMFGATAGPFPISSLANHIISMFPGSRISSLFRPGSITASGNTSLHGLGRAVDIAGSRSVMKSIWDYILGNVASLNIQELIFEHMIWSKSRGKVGPWTRDDHMDHVHVGINEIFSRGVENAGSGSPRDIVQSLMGQYGFGPNQWPSLEKLIGKESGWRPNADNPTSTAYGLFQFLKSTWDNYITKRGGPAHGTPDVMWQARGGLEYIKSRYGSPDKALEFHNANNWYHKGGPVGHKHKKKQRGWIPIVAKTSQDAIYNLIESMNPVEKLKAEKMPAHVGAASRAIGRGYDLERLNNAFKKKDIDKGALKRMNPPKLDTGGFIVKSGIAEVHKGEQVLNKTQQMGNTEVKVDLHFDGGYFGTERELSKLVDTIERRIVPKINRSKGFDQRTIGS